MPRVSEMQGVSAYIECLTTTDKRRHPAYCIFAEGKGKARICTCPQSFVYYKHCSTSKNCEYYEEKE